ncbi:excinuclease ABC subunit A [Klebsiella pneumoniae]
MVVFTGISGSGKSSLAFDTLYAEAQRRFMESVAPHARRLIEQASAPDVDGIDGLPPAVALQQSRAGAQERSTVGSLTRISVTLRLLFSRAGLHPADIPFLPAEAFSPNNPQGACPACQGMGMVHEVKADALVPDGSLSIREGAIASWPNGWQAKNLRSILDSLGYDIDAPWETLAEKDREWILFTDEQPSVPIFMGLNAEQRREAIAAGTEPAYIISRLFGVIYVLDEPAAGLHPEDVRALLQSLRLLLEAGNSLVIVEHNLDVIAEADWLTEVGPGPGRLGGEIVYNGAPSGMARISRSPTAGYLFDKHRPGLRRRRLPERWLELEQITCNNIHGLDVRIPLERMTAITGVSGSGKSTLLARVLPALLQRLDKTPEDDESEEDNLVPEVQGKITAGGTSLKRLVRIDQKPIGRTPRSNLATYTGFFDTVRKLFADTNEAKKRNFDASRFSFNLPAGRCPSCEGQGQITIELMFMPEASAPCSACGGRRYNEETLQVRWHNRTIADVLDLTVDEAVEVFRNNDSIQRSLAALAALGLGYLKLGQPATELSGGECQRIKLAWELQRVQRGKTLYLLDEPSTGLHPADMDKLMRVLDRLVQRGDTVVMAEHDMRIAAEADWVLDLGPGSGENGGRIVATGTPEEVSRSKHSLTAPWLAARLKKRNGDPDE